MIMCLLMHDQEPATLSQLYSADSAAVHRRGPNAGAAARSAAAVVPPIDG